MSFKVESHSTQTGNTSNQTEMPNSGKLNSKTVVMIDPSYINKEDFQAGVVGCILRSLITTALIFASFAAAIVVGVKTMALLPALVTLGCCLGVVLLINILMRLLC